MFTHLTDDLLDLTATEKGFGGALYAMNDEGGCSSSSSSLGCCWDLPCHICW